MSVSGPFRDEYEGAALLEAEPAGEAWEEELGDPFAAREEAQETWLQPEAESWAEELVGNEATFEDEPDLESGPELELELPLAETLPLQEAESLFDEATETIRRALEVVKTRARIAEGTRDESKLTNLVFFARHPEAAGRPLSKDNPHFEELRWEWLAIRDTIVRPALQQPAPSAAYDREGAMAYARKFWLQPCDDGFVGLGGASGKTFAAVEPGTKFVHDSGSEHAVRPDGSEIPWAHLDDCTHFISCCIGQRPGERCGGLKITLKQLGEPPDAPYGIVRVSSMVQYLVAKGYARAVAEKTEDESTVGRLSPGDLIAYFNKSRGIYSHLALLLPDAKIACHTYGRSDQPECTWDNSWLLGKGTHSWTFLQLV